MKQWILSIFTAVFLLHSGAAVAGTPQEAQKYIDTVSSQVLDIIKTKDSKAEKLAKLEVVFSSAVNIPYVGKYVLGKNWRNATPAQQQAYLDAYKPFVIKNYAGKLTRYSGQNYTLKNARQSGDNYIVTMEIIDPGNASVYVDYRLREENRKYAVIDIAVEGVSLVATQRSEFNSIVNSKGLDYLIEALKKQVAAKAA